MEVDPNKEIDIEFTDDESDSEYDETKSDKDFIITDDLSDVGDDQTYVPTDEYHSSSEDDSTTEIFEYYGDESCGDNIIILGKRYVMEGEEEKRQLLIRGWVDEGVVADMTRTANLK